MAVGTVVANNNECMLCPLGPKNCPLPRGGRWREVTYNREFILYF